MFPARTVTCLPLSGQRLTKADTIIKLYRKSRVDCPMQFKKQYKDWKVNVRLLIVKPDI